jgi:hypothetical protein
VLRKKVLDKLKATCYNDYSKRQEVTTMKYEVKSYSFFKVNGGYETISNGQHCRFSAEMFECMKRQYIMNGFEIFWENDCFISFSKVLNEIEVFSYKLNQIGKN